MRLSKRKFNELLQKNKLVLSLTGMSNTGKTYWSKKLAKFDFKHFNCDDLIEIKLASKLKKLGYSGINDVSRWMGQPYDKRYKKNQQKYLNSEKTVMKDVFSEIKNKKQSNNIVIDTTGSVVHCGGNIYRELKKQTIVVYLETTDIMRKEMFNRYIKDPKPVIFGRTFIVRKGETNKQALKKCYVKLLNYRHGLYSKYADVIIPCSSIAHNLDTKKFINLIKKELA